jgi:hypothetical protein
MRTVSYFMFELNDKPNMAARLYSGLIELASETDENGVSQTDVMTVIQHISGILVETYFVFEDPDKAMEASFDKLSKLLSCEPYSAELPPRSLPPAHVIDSEVERGRNIARTFFEEWMECAYEFHDVLITVLHNVIVSWEDDGQSRQETLRLLMECTLCGMAFEIAAQELCDVVIEKQVAHKGWDLSECVASLSAVAGRRLAVSLDLEACLMFRGAEMPDELSGVVYTMTKEAVRLGVPAGSDWRFGLPANDVPVNAPVELIHAIEPYCAAFFETINLNGPYEQAVACAKAAGRMVAVASGGECPEIEPAIAKPLAMSAMTETYKSVCMTQMMVLQS